MKRLQGFLAAMCLAGTVLASDVEPDVLVKSVTSEVLDIVRKDKDIQNGSAAKSAALVEAKVAPHFNFVRMTQLALGREARQVSPDQLKGLTEEFRRLLVRTYSKALSEFRDQEVSYKPFKMTVTETDVKVRTEVRQSGGKPIGLDYYLEKTAGGWKVYDMEVGGVSLVTNYRSSFAREIQSAGVEGLLRSLQNKNKPGDSAAITK